MSLISVLWGIPAALAFLTLPGLAVAWGLGLQGALRLIAAVPLSLGIWAGASGIAIGLQLPWRVWLALPLCALITAPFLLGRVLALRGKASWPLTPHTPVSPLVWVLSAGGALVSVFPFWVGSDWGTRPPQTWDTVFHLSAIRYTRVTASASPWEAYADIFGSTPTYYPNIFHNLAALLPGEPLQAYLAMLSAVLLAWPLTVALFALLAVVRLRGSGANAQNTAALAALGAAMGVNFPANQVSNLATAPYLVSLLALPGLVILGISIYRLWPVSVSVSVPRPRESLRRMLYSSQLAPWLGLAMFVGVIGSAATHPASVFNLALLLGMPLAWLFIRWLRKGGASKTTKIAVTVIILLLLGFFSRWTLQSRLRSMTVYANQENDLWLNLWRLLADYPKGDYNWGFGIGGTLFTVASVFAVITLWQRRRLGWLIAGAGISLLFYAVAAGTIWPFYYLAAPWYLQYTRIAPVFWLCVWTLGAQGMVTLWNRLTASPLFFNARGLRRVLPILTLFALLVSTSGATILGRTQMVRSAYDPQQIVRGTMLSDPEREFMSVLAAEIEPESVIWGAAYQGTSYWWILHGIPVVSPAVSWPDKETVAVMRDLGDGDGKIRTESCTYLRERGVTHYYADNDTQANGAKHGHFNWVWKEDKVSFALPRHLLSNPVKNRLSKPGEPFRGQILYQVDLDKCGQ